MSKVSGVTLITCCSEDIGHAELLQWTRKQDIAAQFEEIADGHSGGNKHPQIHVWCAGFNYFDEDAFAAFVGALDWKRLDNVVLSIQPEDGRSRVWRFINGVWGQLP